MKLTKIQQLATDTTGKREVVRNIIPTITPATEKREIKDTKEVTITIKAPKDTTTKPATKDTTPITEVTKNLTTMEVVTTVNTTKQKKAKRVMVMTKKDLTKRVTQPKANTKSTN